MGLLLKKHITALQLAGASFGMNVAVSDHVIFFSASGNKQVLHFSEKTSSGTKWIFPPAFIIHSPEKIAAVMASRLGLNKRIFARNCEIRRLNKPESSQFFNANHLMAAARSAFNYGLFHKDVLVTAAAFSKGRRMNRLMEDKRSFELIRFCTLPGYTVTGGLSKLIRHFVSEKDPGDIMTYVDKQFSEGTSFLKAGFKKIAETEPQTFLLDPVTLRKANPSTKTKNLLEYSNEGNLKLVYVPGASIILQGF